MLRRVAPLLLSLLLFPDGAPAGEVVVGRGDRRIRVQALSPTLVRIEPVGPRGFEDHSTFNIVGRHTFGGGVAITLLNESDHAAWLQTASFLIYVPTPGPAEAAAGCPGASAPPQMNTTLAAGAQLPTRNHPHGASVPSWEECCRLCALDPDCRGWVYHGAAEDEEMVNCSPLVDWFAETSPMPGAVHGVVRNHGALSAARVTTPAGEVIWDGSSIPTAGGANIHGNLLHWPSPLDARAYAFSDSPRFRVPAWGPTPLPINAAIDPALRATNGFDFRNEQDGDTYIFLLGDSLDSWYASRAEFISLTGSTPLLPDFAFGTWYTWSHRYTEDEAKHDIEQWQAGKFPLDVWGLDNNWRNLDNSNACDEHYYDRPNGTLFPGLVGRRDGGSAQPGEEWFAWLRHRNIRTYFNDHPHPVSRQCSPAEVGFRWKGLSEWLRAGLDFWWLDHNWGYSIPAAQMPWNASSKPGTRLGSYKGLTSEVWGCYVYFEITAALHRSQNRGERPITLCRDNGLTSGWCSDARFSWDREQDWSGRWCNHTDAGDWAMQTIQGAGSPAHHRYPVWWTGDSVPLMASVASMVQEAVHDFRAFVHSDCGGHGGGGKPGHGSDPGFVRPTDAAFLRWTAHCVFGTILRYHQGDHRIWLYDNSTQSYARRYLQLRYKMAPSLISAGRTLQSAGFPLTARCDLVFPEYAEAKDPTQYLHLNSSLVAPLDEDASTRQVWIPPGQWQDAWDGAIVTGPRQLRVTKPAHQLPMWHRRGSFVVTVASEAQRITEQDWSELTVEAFPAFSFVHRRQIYSQDRNPATADLPPAEVSIGADAHGQLELRFAQPARNVRSWLVRLHLRVGQRLRNATAAAADGHGHITLAVEHLDPRASCTGSGATPGGGFPFAGVGVRPACRAGPVAEFRLPTCAPAKPPLPPLACTWAVAAAISA